VRSARSFVIRPKKRPFGRGSLTEIGLAHCPIDHGELQACAQQEEERQEAVDTEALLSGPTVQQTTHGSAVRTHVFSAGDYITPCLSRPLPGEIQASRVCAVPPSHVCVGSL